MARKCTVCLMYEAGRSPSPSAVFTRRELCRYHWEIYIGLEKDAAPTPQKEEA